MMGICLSDMETQISFWDLPRIRFVEDDSDLHSSFVKDSEHEYLFEHENNYIIKVNGVYYGPLKSQCMKVS